MLKLKLSLYIAISLNYQYFNFWIYSFVYIRKIVMYNTMVLKCLMLNPPSTDESTNTQQGIATPGAIPL